MAAPKGNRFWEMRSKHGKDELFASSDLLWEAACEYFQWCDENTLYTTEQRKGNVIIPKGMDAKDLKNLLKSTVDLPAMRAYTLKGLCVFLGINTGYFNDFKRRLKDHDEKEPRADAEDFLNVIERIEDVIYVQKFEGAAAGLLNGNIIARELGLADKKEHKLDEPVSFTLNI